MTDPAPPEDEPQSGPSVGDIEFIGMDLAAGPDRHVETVRVAIIGRGGATFMALAALHASGRLVGVLVTDDRPPPIDLARIAKMTEPDYRPGRLESSEPKQTKREWRQAMKGAR